MSSDSHWAQHMPPPCPRQWSWETKSPASSTGPASKGGWWSGHNIVPSTKPAGLKPTPVQRCPCPQDKTTPGASGHSAKHPEGGQGGQSLPGRVPPPGCLPLPYLGPHSVHSPENHLDCHGPWSGEADQMSMLAATMAGLSLPDAASEGVPITLAVLCLLPSRPPRRDPRSSQLPQLLQMPVPSSLAHPAGPRAA